MLTEALIAKLKVLWVLSPHLRISPANKRPAAEECPTQVLEATYYPARSAQRIYGELGEAFLIA